MFIWLFVFFSNARYSEEFSGWVKITVAGSLDENKLTQDITQYMESKWYKDSNVAVELGDNTTKLSLKTSTDKDEEVSILSKDIQSILVQKWYIKSTSEVIEQSITGPSVWSYMQKSAKNALIVWVILMAIYMIFSFAGVRKEISPTILAGVVIFTMIFDVGMPAWAYGVWMMLDHTMTVNTIFIVAVLTNMWYSNINE